MTVAHLLIGKRDAGIQANAGKQQSNPEPAPTAPPAPTENKETADYQPNCARPQKHEDALYCEVRRLADKAKESVAIASETNWSGWAQAGAALLAILVAAWAANEARRAAHASNVAARVARDSFRHSLQISRQQSRDARQAIREARRTADAAERSLIVTQSASVVLRAMQNHRIVDPTTKNAVAWQFWAVWENIGATQTTNLRSVIHGTISPRPLPTDHPFVAAAAEPGQGVIGPRSTINSGMLTIGADAVKAILAKQAFYYLWGWCEYGLIFPNTPTYLVEFCHQVVFEGDPISGTGRVTFVLHGPRQGQREVGGGEQGRPHSP